MTTRAPAVVKIWFFLVFPEVKDRIADDDVAALSGTDISTHRGFQQQEGGMVVHNGAIFLCSLVVGNIDDR